MPITGELVIDYKGNYESTLLPKIDEESAIREQSSDTALHGFMFHVQNMKKVKNNLVDESSQEVETGRSLLQSVKRGIQLKIDNVTKNNKIAPMTTPKTKESLKTLSGKVVNVEVEKAEEPKSKKSQ